MNATCTAHRRQPRQDQDECGGPPPATKQDADLVAQLRSSRGTAVANYSAPRGFGAGFISRARERVGDARTPLPFLDVRRHREPSNTVGRKRQPVELRRSWGSEMLAILTVTSPCPFRASGSASITRTSQRGWPEFLSRSAPAVRRRRPLDDRLRPHRRTKTLGGRTRRS